MLYPNNTVTFSKLFWDWLDGSRKFWVWKTDQIKTFFFTDSRVHYRAWVLTRWCRNLFSTIKKIKKFNCIFVPERACVMQKQLLFYFLLKSVKQPQLVFWSMHTSMAIPVKPCSLNTSPFQSMKRSGFSQCENNLIPEGVFIGSSAPRLTPT